MNDFITVGADVQHIFASEQKSAAGHLRDQITMLIQKIEGAVRDREL
jgi:hypothetical protein